MQNYDEVHCVTFDYGQRHRFEIEVAQKLSVSLGAAAHKVLDVTLLNELAISSLTRDSIPVPDFAESESSALPSTFVPGRNILFLISCNLCLPSTGRSSDNGGCETDFQVTRTAEMSLSKLSTML